MSLASVLVISVKVRRFLRKVAASASDACRRTSPSASCSRFSVGSKQHLLAADVEAQLGHRLVEEAVPGAAAGHRLLVEELLDAVLELVGLVLPEIDDPGPVVAEQRVGVERLLDQLVVDQVQLQREEQQMRAGVRHLLLDVAIELGALRVRGVAGIDQPGIGRDAADQLLQRLEIAQCGAELAGRAFFRFGRQRALPAALERLRIAPGALDVGLQLRRGHAGIEVGEVPFRQVAERGLCLPGRRGCRSVALKISAFWSPSEGRGREKSKDFVHRLF